MISWWWLWLAASVGFFLGMWLKVMIDENDLHFRRLEDDRERVPERDGDLFH